MIRETIAEIISEERFSILLTYNLQLINMCNRKNISIVRSANYEYIIINKKRIKIIKKIICLEKNIQIILSECSNYLLNYISDDNIRNVIFLS